MLSNHGFGHCLHVQEVQAEVHDVLLEGEILLHLLLNNSHIFYCSVNLKLNNPTLWSRIYQLVMAYVPDPLQLLNKAIIYLHFE